MKKNKTKNKNKKAAGNKTLLGGAAKSLKKLGKLTTTQKVLGGAALVAAGLGYLGTRRKSTIATPPTSDSKSNPNPSAAEQTLASMDEGAF